MNATPHEKLDYIHTPELNALKKKYQEISYDPVWSVSTAKLDCGAKYLIDDNYETFWQSDGKQFPHSINIQFPKKVSIAEIGIYLNYEVDETYTPQHIIIKSGTIYNDLYEVKSVEIVDPMGWTFINLCINGRYLRTNFLQIGVMSNYMNGRDSRIRQIKVFGARKEIRSTSKIENEEIDFFKLLK